MSQKASEKFPQTAALLDDIIANATKLRTTMDSEIEAMPPLKDVINNFVELSINAEAFVEVTMNTLVEFGLSNLTGKAK